MRKYGPKHKDHKSIGSPCPLCHVEFKENDFTTLLALFPDGIEQAERMLDGMNYTAHAVEVHVHCAEKAGYKVED